MAVEIILKPQCAQLITYQPSFNSFTFLSLSFSYQQQNSKNYNYLSKFLYFTNASLMI